jgi:hypothetical protein
MASRLPTLSDGLTLTHFVATSSRAPGWVTSTRALGNLFLISACFHSACRRFACSGSLAATSATQCISASRAYQRSVRRERGPGFAAIGRIIGQFEGVARCSSTHAHDGISTA